MLLTLKVLLATVNKETNQSSGVGLTLAVKQEFGSLDITAVGSHMEWGQVVDCDFVQWGFVVQQQTGAVLMVSLGRHVQRGEAILEIMEENGKPSLK